MQGPEAAGSKHFFFPADICEVSGTHGQPLLVKTESERRREVAEEYYIDRDMNMIVQFIITFLKKHENKIA